MNHQLSQTSFTYDCIFGLAAGTIAKYVEYPGDVVKVHMQCRVIDSRRQLRPQALDCFLHIWNQGGLRRLYRGVGAPVLASALETSSLFASYNLIQQYVQSTWHPVVDASTHQLPLSWRTACAAFAGASTSFILTPLEYLKCNLQIYPSARARESLSGREKSGLYRYGSLISTTLKNHGVYGLWRGQLGTMLREMGGTAAWFGVYEKTTEMLHSAQISHDRTPSNFSLWKTMIAGGAAGVAYNVACYPADTIKARMQTTVRHGTASSVGFFAAGKAIIQEAGIVGLYRGCGVAVCCIAPGSAVIFLVYEALRYYLIPPQMKLEE